MTDTGLPEPPSKLYLKNALQDPLEIDTFCELMQAEKLTSYLEIGAKFGGSLWRIAQIMQPQSRIVVVDLPHGTKAWGDSSKSLTACTAALTAQGHETSLIWGDSSAPRIVDEVKSHAPFDLILIDADHRMPGLLKDWENYGPLGRIIAFHDIAWHRAEDFAVYHRIDVPRLWKMIKNRYRSKEIMLDPSGRNNGIGVIWNER